VSVDASIPDADDAPRISVIVPVRNDPLRLGRCLTALRQSTFQDFEMIVVDDASTDGTTPAVAESLGARLIRLSENGGPARARNRGVAEAAGGIVFFVDADVVVHRDTLANVVRAFEEDSGVAAVFGSYDDQPEHPAVISQYKNLQHHFVHQHGNAEARTFWSGCGAMRREVFTALGGFDTVRFDRPCIEDIDLGVRATRAGHRIRLDKRIQATHLKRWTLRSLIRTDIFDRGIPWTRLLLRERDVPNDLNLGVGQRLAAVLAGMLVLAWGALSVMFPLLLALPVIVYGAVLVADAFTARSFAAPVRIAAWVIAAGVAAGVVWIAGLWSLLLAGPLAGIVALNVPFYRFYIRARGLTFTLAVLPLHVLYYLYSGAALAMGIAGHLLDRGRALPATLDPQPEPS
jgi:GT2 family glycosyltransferase